MNATSPDLSYAERKAILTGVSQPESEPNDEISDRKSLSEYRRRQFVRELLVYIAVFAGLAVGIYFGLPHHQRHFEAAATLSRVYSSIDVREPPLIVLQ